MVEPSRLVSADVIEVVVALGAAIERRVAERQA
jgi:hypothetical protein